MISCLTITQPGRLPELARAIACFRSQTLTEREMVIVHDGNQDFHRDLQQLVDLNFYNNQFQLHQISPGSTLGALRNFAVACARYPLVCQWDDDDIYHPRRLELQFAGLKIQGAAVCFLTEQLHLFEAQRRLCWDDWNVEAPPMHLIPGTLMGYRDALGRYPALGKGEDTPIVLDLVERGIKVIGLRNLAWLYIYSYTGKNVWDLDHHTGISAWKQISGERIEALMSVLSARLREYPVDLGEVFMDLDERRVTLRVGRGD
mgnify:CR=1 FL=1